MTIQEKRDSEEFHLSAAAFVPIWEESKRVAAEAVEIARDQLQFS